MRSSLTKELVRFYFQFEFSVFFFFFWKFRHYLLTIKTTHSAKISHKSESIDTSCIKSFHYSIWTDSAACVCLIKRLLKKSCFIFYRGNFWIYFEKWWWFVSNFFFFFSFYILNLPNNFCIYWKFNWFFSVHLLIPVISRLGRTIWLNYLVLQPGIQAILGNAWCLCIVTLCKLLLINPKKKNLLLLSLCTNSDIKKCRANFQIKFHNLIIIIIINIHSCNATKWQI